MIKRVQSPFTATTALGIGKPLAVAALCLSMASHVLAEQQSARVQHAQSAPAAGEESVLVATREAPPSVPAGEKTAANAEDNETLEPIAQSSDVTPELAVAADYEESSKNFGDALTKVAQPPKPASTAATVSPAAATTVTSEAQNTEEAEESETAAPTGTARCAASARSHSVSFEPVKFQGISVGNNVQARIGNRLGAAHRIDRQQRRRSAGLPQVAVQNRGSANRRRRRRVVDQDHARGAARSEAVGRTAEPRTPRRGDRLGRRRLLDLPGLSGARRIVHVRGVGNGYADQRRRSGPPRRPTRSLTWRFSQSTRTRSHIVPKVVCMARTRKTSAT